MLEIKKPNQTTFEASVIRDIEADLSHFRESVKTMRRWKPLVLNLYLNSRCNVRCIFCKDWLFDSDSLLPSAKWEQIILESKGLGGKYVVFSGGEPTLYADLAHLISCTSKNGLYSILNTNGVILLDELVTYLNAGLRELVITIHSLRPNFHNRLCQTQGAWERTVQSIRYLSEIKKEYPDLEMTLRYMLMHGNMLYLPAIVEKAFCTWNVDKLSIVPISVRPILSQKDHHLIRIGYPALIPNLEEILIFKEKVLPGVLDKARRIGLIVSGDTPFGSSTEDIHYYLQGTRTKCLTTSVSCFQTWYTAHIHHDGRLLGCNSVKDPVNVVGNLQTLSLYEIFNSTVSRSMDYSYKRIYPECLNCKATLTRMNITIQKLLSN